MTPHVMKYLPFIIETALLKTHISIMGPSSVLTKAATITNLLLFQKEVQHTYLELSCPS